MVDIGPFLAAAPALASGLYPIMEGGLTTGSVAEWSGAHLGEVLVLQPGSAESYWQPVPSKGFIDVPHRAAPRCHGASDRARHARPWPSPRTCGKHGHDRNEEVVFVLAGEGRAVIDGESHPMRPGSAFFIGARDRAEHRLRGPTHRLTATLKADLTDALERQDCSHHRGGRWHWFGNRRALHSSRGRSPCWQTSTVTGPRRLRAA